MYGHVMVLDKIAQSYCFSVELYISNSSVKILTSFLAWVLTDSYPKVGSVIQRIYVYIYYFCCNKTTAMVVSLQQNVQKYKSILA